MDEDMVTIFPGKGPGPDAETGVVDRLRSVLLSVARLQEDIQHACSTLGSATRQVRAFHMRAEPCSLWAPLDIGRLSGSRERPSGPETRDPAAATIFNRDHLGLLICCQNLLLSLSGALGPRIFTLPALLDIQVS